MKNDDKRLAGGRRWFEYHCWENEESSDAEAWHHTHQRVQVLEKIQDANDEGCEISMYRVRFPDGVEWDVFDDELVSDPSEFYRPDYKRKVVGSKSARGSRKRKDNSYAGVQAVSLCKER